MKKTYRRPYRENQVKRVEMYCKNNNLSYTNLTIYDGYVTFNGWSNITYEQLVNKLVRERYSDSAEFAILRKAMSNVTDEFLIYNAYVEECKLQAKAFIEEREKELNEWRKNYFRN